MEVIEYVALARSGHHAIVNWFLKNMIGQQCSFNWQVTIAGDSGLVHWNDSTVYVESCLNELKKLDEPNILSICYDNELYDFSHVNKLNATYRKCIFNGWEVKKTRRFLVIRDFYNNLVSRMKMFHDLNEERSFYDERFISVWKNHARACVENKIDYIKYEDWLTSTEKRQELLSKFGVKEKYDNTNISGKESSFGKSKDYLNRYDSNLVPENIKELIRKDGELHYLIGKMNYKYVEI
jgi:hypothetical protein